MKRNFLQIFMIALLPLFVVSCIDNTPEVEKLPQDPVSFEYRITGDYALDYYIDSEISFINTSPTQGEAVWDFGDGKSATGNSVTHAYDVAGTYEVKLTIAGLSKSQVIMIADIKPLLTINPIQGGICEVGTTPVSFSLEVPNPKKKELTYKWIFPESTTDSTGTVVTTSTSRLPGELKFGNVGSQIVRLQVTMDGRLLEEGVANVQVGYNKEVPTLYYAVQGGHLMAYKIINDAPEGMKVAPFDLGVSSGQHPFNLLFKDSSLYVIDCGTQFYYVNDVDGVLGDGKISVIAKDGSKVETMISNAGQAAFDDPFYGCIDGEDLYFANRNTGITKVPLKTRNAMYSVSEFPYHVKHSTLGYYNNGWGYGSIGGMFGKIKGIWYWCKFYNGTGIFRFKDTDILSADIAAGDDSNVPKDGICLSGMKPKSIAYSTKSDKVCFTLNDPGYGGFYVCTIDELVGIGTSKAALKPYLKVYTDTANVQLGFEPNATGLPRMVEGFGDEIVAICQIAYDEVNDCAYWAYRNNHNDPTGAPTGIYRYSFASDKIEQVIAGPTVYGMVVNNTPSKLF